VEVREVLSKRLKWLREQNRLAQKEVAAEIGITLNGYQKLEYGDREPKLDMLVKLCDFYKVSSDFLLGRNDENETLKKMSFELRNLKFLFTNKRDETEQLNYRVEEAKVEKLSKEVKLKEIEKLLSEGVGDEDRVMNMIMMKDSLKQELVMYEHNIKEMTAQRHEKYRELIFEIQKKVGKGFFEYIEILLGIPLSKPHEDELLKSVSPFRIVIDEVSMGSRKGYCVSIFGKEIGDIGGYGRETLEEAEKLKEELDISLNGIKH
jgi:transcriptional regulator with XRE-family HTH domain